MVTCTTKALICKCVRLVGVRLVCQIGCVEVCGCVKVWLQFGAAPLWGFCCECWLCLGIGLCVSSSFASTCAKCVTQTVSNVLILSSAGKKIPKTALETQCLAAPSEAFRKHHHSIFACPTGNCCPVWRPSEPLSWCWWSAQGSALP